MPEPRSTFIRRLSHKPVRHSCGHFEARLMSYPVEPELGYAPAGSVCSTCDPQGRNVQPNHPTLEAVQAACAELDVQTGRSGPDGPS